MINTILFDLDGTLLSMDTEKFIESYFKQLGIAFKDHFTSEEVAKYFWLASENMINDKDSSKTNEEAFFEEFNKHINGQQKALSVLIKDFYKNDFNKVKKVSSESIEIIEAVKILKAKGYSLVVATNPLFPKEAIRARIKWAGLNIEDFDYKTTFEHMHYTKPNINYYKEILADLEKDASECLMVGNDIKEDMVANEIGIETYLITNNIIGDLDDNKNIDYQGDYVEFLNYVRKLPNLN